MAPQFAQRSPIGLQDAASPKATTAASKLKALAIGTGFEDQAKALEPGMGQHDFAAQSAMLAPGIGSAQDSNAPTMAPGMHASNGASLKSPTPTITPTSQSAAKKTPTPTITPSSKNASKKTPTTTAAKSETLRERLKPKKISPRGELERTNEASIGVTDWSYDWDDMDGRLDRMKENKEAGEEDPTLGSYHSHSEIYGEQHSASKTHTHKSAERTTTSELDASATVGITSDSDGYVSGKDAWLDGGKMGVGGRTRHFAGAEAEATASGTHSIGPRVGAIDPATGERKGILNVEGHVASSGKVGAEASAQGEAYVEGTSARAAGKASASVGAETEASAGGGTEIDVGGLVLAGTKAELAAQASTKAEASAEGDVQVGPSGVKARGEAGAEAMAKAGVETSATQTLLGAHFRGGGSASAEAGVKAGAGGNIAVGPATLGASGGVEAFAGAKAQIGAAGGVGFVGVDFLTASIDLTAAAGVGAELGGGFMINDGIITINFDVLGAAGGGLGLSGQVSMDVLAGFKMILAMLEKNGILSSNMATWIPEIMKMTQDPEAQLKKMAGQPDAYEDTSTDDVSVRRHEPSDAGAGMSPPGHARSSDVGGLGLSAVGPSALGSGASAMSGARPPRDSAPTALAARTSSLVPPLVDGKKAQDKTLALAKLSEAHCLVGDANAETNDAVLEAMEGLKKGIGDPIQTIMAIMTGGGAALAKTIGTGLQTAGALVGQVAKLAAATTERIAGMIFRFFEALFSGGLGALFGGYDTKVKAMDAQHSAAVESFNKETDAVKQKANAELMGAIQSGLSGIAGEFLARSKDGGKSAKAKAAKAEGLIDEVASAPIVDDQGAVYQVGPDAKRQVGEVVGLLNGTESAAEEGASAVSGAAPEVGNKATVGMTCQAEEKKRLGAPAITDAYAGPKGKVDEQVDKKRQAVA